MTEPGALITGVIEGSPAWKSGIKTGDMLLTIGGRRVRDILDYLYLSSGTRFAIEIGRDTITRTVIIRKNDDEALGLRFDTELFDTMKLCRNRCPFCFVDQVPPGMRKTLTLKDDDYRLSFLNGNFISLTNMGGEDWDRIKAYGLSPLYISVHSTNPSLRRRIFGHKNAGDIMDILQAFRNWNIFIHAQVVLCPGINDGEELERTVTELSGLYPTVQSIAVVPVGVTRYMNPSSPVRPLTIAEMRTVIATSTTWRRTFKKRHHHHLLYLADEFFIKTGMPIPPLSYYGEFPQIENGIGMARKLLTDFHRRKGRMGTLPLPPSASISIITGKSAGPLLEEVTGPFSERGFPIRVHPVENRFWGAGVDVAGLLTGEDILSTLDRDGAGDYIIIPTLSLKDEYLCLDDLTIEDIEARTGSKVIPVDPTFGALKEALLQIEGFHGERGIKGNTGKKGNKV